jgi:hypothetical protein
MTEDEKAQMFLDECLFNAGVTNKSPFEDKKEKDDEDEREAYHKIPSRY